MKFVTLMPRCEAVLLRKDVGMIPYNLHLFYDYDVKIACIDPTDMFSEEREKYPKMEIEVIEPCCGSEWMGISKYIYQNAKQMDVLNMYHMSMHRSLLWAWIYKYRNPKGKFYLKLDMDYRSIVKLKGYSRVKLQLLRHMAKRVDVISAESKGIYTEIEKLLDREIAYIPNGYFETSDIEKSKVQKEKTFLTVGRLGTQQKATEVLLEAYAEIAQETDYTLRLVGSVEPQFQDFIDNYFAKHPQVEGKVCFVGNIKEADILRKEYEKARIFVLPSRWEGFPLVVPEAMQAGCYLVVSDQVPPADEITAQGRYGKIVPVDDVQALAQALKAAAVHLDQSEVTIYQEIRKYADRNFSWKKIVGKLNQVLKE